MTSTMLRMIAVWSRAWHWAKPSFARVTMNFDATRST